MIDADGSEHAIVRRPAKSEAAFRTISEVSEDLDVPQHVLRFWESKFSQIKPLKRGGGRRYYRPEDLVLLKRIRDLLYKDGYTIRGVQKLLRDQSRGHHAPAAETVGDPDESRSDEDASSASEATGELSGDGPSPEEEGDVPAAAQPQLDLADPAMTDGASNGDHRRELRELLAELQELRSLLARARHGG